MLSSLKGKDGAQEIEKLDDFAQGHQRLLIASILKACADIISENVKEKSVVILFEEPEIYMHPKLKARLKDALKKISETFQVIISTHDPYFIFGIEESKLYSLYKENNETKVHPEEKVEGIVDDLLHINLYAEMLDGDLEQMQKFERPYYKQKLGTAGDGDADFEEREFSLPEYIRHQIHHPENKRVKGLVEEIPKEGKVNYYTRGELGESITLMRQRILDRE